ncbi:MAG: hypothetical protein IJ736_09820, partial [Firmicutes bacterium]|nr:hypothetical protein [Bacillota bacterium]
TFSIEEGLSMNMTFNEVKGYLKDRGIKFMEGAEYNFNGEFNCLWIDDLKNYEFYFFARSKKTKMGGFKYYNFSE